MCYPTDDLQRTDYMLRIAAINWFLNGIVLGIVFAHQWYTLVGCILLPGPVYYFWGRHVWQRVFRSTDLSCFDANYWCHGIASIFALPAILWSDRMWERSSRLQATFEKAS